MYWRQMNPHVRIALIGTHHESTRLGNCEIYPCKRGPSRKEFIPKVSARGTGEVNRIFTARIRPEVFMKDFANLALTQMNGWHHNVAGRLMCKLNNPLAQVRVNHFDTLPFKVRIEMAFFR
jgi:hypothetical protein